MKRRSFWYPLTWWQALGIFFVAQIVANFALALARQSGVVSWPPWVAGGIGGALGVLCVTFVAKRKGSDG
jgi:hypothetical protein